MKPTRAVAAVLLCAACAWGQPATASWQRQLQFAKMLTARRYYDLAQTVVDRLLADKRVKEADRPGLHRELGEYYADLAANVRGRDAMQRFTEYLALSRKHYDLYLKAHPDFEVRTRLVWIVMRLAEGHARLVEDPDVPKPEKDSHRKQAIDAYTTAIKAFEALLAEKKTEEAKVKARQPQEKSAREKWDKAYNDVRNEHVQVRMYVDSARVDLAKFLKRTGAPDNQWKPPLSEAINDYKKMLLEFSANAIVQVNVPLVEAMLLEGPTNDQDAIERLDDVWRARTIFKGNGAVPCRAMFVKGTILVRQKKYKEALDVLDEMLKARTQDGAEWDPDAISIDNVTKVLEELDGGDEQRRFDKKAVGETLLLEAGTYATLAKQAEDAKKPAKDVRQLYAIAYSIAEGVAEANVRIDAALGPLMERWRKKANFPQSINVLKRLAEEALRKKHYGEAARLYTDILTQSRLEPGTARLLWDTIAKCYYGNKEYYRAYIVFTTLARWYPNPVSSAYDNSRNAVGAMKQQLEASKSGFDKAVYERAQKFSELLSPIGPGKIYIDQAIDEREKGQYEQALATLRKIRPDTPAYPYALYQTALTYKAMLQKLPKEEHKTIKGQQLIKATLDSFQAVLDYYTKKAPTLKDQEEELQRLLDIASAALAIYVDIYVREPVNNPLKALEITANLTKQYPGIEKAPTFGVICFNRMHAAYLLIRDGTIDDAAKYLPIVEEAWKTVQDIPEFRFMDKACAIGADSYNRLAAKLEEQAKKTADPAAKADLEKRIAAARDRGLAFYLELIGVVPAQTIKTYRYILYQLDKRQHDPKSNDYREIIKIAPAVIERFENDRRAYDDVLQVKAALAAAYASMGDYRAAIPILEDIDATLEPGYQKRMQRYEQLKALNEKDPRRYEKPKLPQRSYLHVETRERLARSYLETGTKAKLPVAEQIYLEHLRIYDRAKPNYWEAFYYLCATYIREGNYAEAVKQLDRAVLVTGGRMGDGIVKDTKGLKKDFRELATKLRADVDKLADASVKDTLLPLLDRMIETWDKTPDVKPATALPTAAPGTAAAAKAGDDTGKSSYTGLLVLAAAGVGIAIYTIIAATRKKKGSASRRRASRKEGDNS